MGRVKKAKKKRRKAAIPPIKNKKCENQGHKSIVVKKLSEHESGKTQEDLDVKKKWLCVNNREIE